MTSGHPPDVVEFVRSVNGSGGAYHRIDFGDGLVMEGERDLERHLPSYGLPSDLTGMTVLDVGTASGYFAVEFARRGAEVTAVDLWDGSFQEMVFRAARVDVRYVQIDLFDLDEIFGRFDLVFCGSVLMHVWDQFTALRRLRSVCGRDAIIATAIMPARPVLRRKPLARFVGERATDRSGAEYWNTWEPNVEALVAMVTKAGFANVRYHGSLRLQSLVGVVHASAA